MDKQELLSMIGARSHYGISAYAGFAYSMRLARAVTRAPNKSLIEGF